MNNQGSMQNKWKDEYPESKTVWRIYLDNGKHSKIYSQELKCFFWHVSTLFKVLRLVVSTQTNHTCHIIYLNWEIIFSLLMFFPHWAHADSSFVVASDVSRLYTVPYNHTFGAPE